MKKRLIRGSLEDDAAYKKSVLIAARKAQTHLANVLEMLEKDCYCVDVIQQALAVQGLWKGVIRRVFVNHVQTCFRDALCRGTKQDQESAIAEISRVMELAGRS